MSGGVVGVWSGFGEGPEPPKPCPSTGRRIAKREIECVIGGERCQYECPATLRRQSGVYVELQLGRRNCGTGGRTIRRVAPRTPRPHMTITVQNNKGAASRMKISIVFGPTPSNSARRFSNARRSLLAATMLLTLPAYSLLSLLASASNRDAVLSS